jgi:hypothetical protein
MPLVRRLREYTPPFWACQYPVSGIPKLTFPRRGRVAVCAASVLASRRYVRDFATNRRGVNGSVRVFFRNLTHDSRFWIVVLTSLCLFLTIERVQAYANGPWPQLQRDRERRPVAMGNPMVWFAVMALLLPGLVLLLANVAILLWAKYPRRSVQVLAAFLLMLPWVVFTIGSFDSLGLGPYMRRVGIALPIALCVSLCLADLLLFFTFLDLVESTNLLDSLKHLRP